MAAVLPGILSVRWGKVSGKSGSWDDMVPQNFGEKRKQAGLSDALSEAVSVMKGECFWADVSNRWL